MTKLAPSSTPKWPKLPDNGEKMQEFVIRSSQWAYFYVILDKILGSKGAMIW
jgi:hypothetical protein